MRQLVAGRNTQCGTVQDLDVLCHLHITGTDKYIYGVSSKNLSPCIPVHVSLVYVKLALLMYM